jgi:hypothetical protein
MLADRSSQAQLEPLATVIVGLLCYLGVGTEVKGRLFWAFASGPRKFLLSKPAGVTQW